MLVLRGRGLGVAPVARFDLGLWPAAADAVKGDQSDHLNCPIAVFTMIQPLFIAVIGHFTAKDFSIIADDY
jgi:hypothetical protein